MTAEIQRISGAGRNAVYAVVRAGERVAHIRRHGRSGWALDSVHYGENRATYRNLNLARTAAVARPYYPDASEAYELVCKRIEQQRRAYMRQQRAGDLADAALDMAVGEKGAANRIILISRSIESIAKDRRDTTERQCDYALAGGDYQRGAQRPGLCQPDCRYIAPGRYLPHGKEIRTSQAGRAERLL
jgi:hypothetical protein